MTPTTPIGQMFEFLVNVAMPVVFIGMIGLAAIGVIIILSSVFASVLSTKRKDRQHNEQSCDDQRTP